MKEPGSRPAGAPDSYGLFTAAAIQDPYPYYRRLRECEPIHWSQKAQAWTFTRYDDVFALQTRPDLASPGLGASPSARSKGLPPKTTDEIAL